MIYDGLTVLFWIAGLAALIGAASWLAHRSYRQFLQEVRGPASTALRRAAPDTPLDRLLDPVEQDHDGQSGLMLLVDNPDAFAARAMSARQAGRSLDLMSYIWSTDISGWLLIDALMAAAGRGVRIRLLLDDVNVQGFDRTFLALSQHPLIEVRLFNPTRQRGQAVRRLAEMVLGLSRFNRRMHGKLWIADGRLAIIGGRNIGDTYFGADARQQMSVDADVMLVGPKVSEVSDVFDSYWNLGLSLPIAALWPALTMNKTAFRRRLGRHVGAKAARRFLAQALAGRDAGDFLTAHLRWTDTVQLLADPPGKAYGLHPAQWISTAVAAVLQAAKSDIRLATPYFVPGASGLADLCRLARRGVRVTLLTNALASTDNVLVFGAYRHSRVPLLAAGARIFEYSRPSRAGRKPDVLHAKVFIIDNQTLIIGSLNYDLRSAFMNTELGLMFDQPDIVDRMNAQFDRFCTPKQAYQLSLDGHSPRWAVKRAGLPPVMKVDPEAPAHRRAVSWIVGHLPIKRYL